jgi:LysR family transcriptional regulator, regulator for genes of the gallate degradation pathway
MASNYVIRYHFVPYCTKSLIHAISTTCRCSIAGCRCGLAMNDWQDPLVNAEQRLQHLQDFLAVVEAGSIARAAKRIFKAPSAITRSISELEARLGTSLFERKPRGMLPNAYGEAVKRRAERVRDEAHWAADEFLRSQLKASASLRTTIINLLFTGRKLQLLILLADFRNISSAAAQMGMTQAGASMALSRIESGIGQSLFQRMMQGMVATDPAARLVMRAKRVFAELRHMESDISSISGNVAGIVAVGTLPLGRTFVVPTAIANALSRHPGLRVTTIESPYEQLVGNLRSGDIDMLFGALRPNDATQGLITKPLFNDRMGIVARAGHPLARRRDLQLADLLSEKWILPKPNAPGRRLVDAAFQELGLQPPIPSVETGDLAILRQLLNSSDMLTAISPPQFMFEIDAGMLAELPVALGVTTRQIGLTLRDGAMLSPAALAVLDAICGVVRVLPIHIDRLDE